MKPCGCKSKRTTDAITASGFFADEQLGPHLSETPEGYLICEAVPIARTGIQEYADIEFPDLEAGPDGIIYVERSPEVVFAPETLASLLGKSVTIGHPKEFVTPDTWALLTKGTIHNPRQGEGEQSNLLLADLLITDKHAINEVRNNDLRGISVGYDADYEQIAPGRARQTSIVANHAALVPNPRCGPTCSVQDSQHPSLGESQMAIKQGAESFKDKLRKLFMTRDSEAFEKALSEEVKDEEMSSVPDIHIHMPGSEKVGGAEETKDDGAADPTAQVAASLKSIQEAVSSLSTRVSKLEGASTKDSADDKDDKDDKEDKETKDDAADGDGDDKDAETMDADGEEEDKDDKKKTSDSASLRDEFQDAKARAEILAPGVKLPTYDAKSDLKKTTDAICVLRRRALKAALENDNAAVVKTVLGTRDISNMTCDAAAMAFNAASEMVKAKNNSVARKSTDAEAEAKDINKRHAEFWANRTA